MTMRMWICALDYTRKARDVILPGLINPLAYTHADRIALLNETVTLTYRDLASRTNRYAHWAIDHGMAGQTVALLMPNCPDYVAIWLGLTRVGCRVALLNTNLHRDALLHCCRAAGAQGLIGADLDGLPEIVFDGLYAVSDLPPDWPLPDPQDIALFIYTSGTSGLPKAAKITHRRIAEWSFWFAGITEAKPEDRLYDCLPMYHSIGGVVAVGSMLVSGGSVVIRERFAANRFWDDVVQSGCTIFQYIGELCRYLTLTPPNPVERQHGLRLAVGNGLQADVWTKFQDRFSIPHILEDDAATEGVLSLYNCDGKPGSIGRIPPMLEPHFAVKLIRVDQETGEPVREAAGLCAVADVDEAGEAISLIKEGRAFDGYSDAEASGRKILSDVLTSGDRWYRTGDLMRKDRAGFYYFVDRLGDTFRWKGENVSTTEVANVVRACPGVSDTVVYGVKVPETEGRAGMAAITTTADFSVETLASHLQRHLPAYARPLFVRWCESLDTTGTFKLTKARFVAEGYTNVSDPIYAWRANGLVPLVQEDRC